MMGDAMTSPVSGSLAGCGRGESFREWPDSARGHGKKGWRRGSESRMPHKPSDAAYVLRHCVCHSLDAGIRALDEIIAGGAP